MRPAGHLQQTAVRAATDVGGGCYSHPHDVSNAAQRFIPPVQCHIMRCSCVELQSTHTLHRPLFGHLRQTSANLVHTLGFYPHCCRVGPRSQQITHIGTAVPRAGQHTRVQRVPPGALFGVPRCGRRAQPFYYAIISAGGASLRRYQPRGTGTSACLHAPAACRAGAHHRPATCSTQLPISRVTWVSRLGILLQAKCNIFTKKQS